MCIGTKLKLGSPLWENLTQLYSTVYVSGTIHVYRAELKPVISYELVPIDRSEKMRTKMKSAGCYSASTAQLDQEKC